MMTDRDLARLTGVHPRLINALVLVFETMESQGHPIFVISGLRTLEEQQRIWRIGRNGDGDITGRVVTYKDGIKFKSNHQPHDDGFGYAVDCAFIGVNPTSLAHPWHAFGEASESHGLIWGGRWTMQDLGHVQLS